MIASSFASDTLGLEASLRTFYSRVLLCFVVVLFHVYFLVAICSFFFAVVQSSAQ